MLLAGMILLQTRSEAKSCELKRSNKKISEECFSEPECMERCGILKGDNCKLQQEKQCKTVNKKQCGVVQEQVQHNKYESKHIDNLIFLGVSEENRKYL